jgi:hypothetical protein
MTKETFSNSIANNSNWFIAASLSTIEIGSHFKDYYNGEMTGEAFLKKTVISMVSNTVGVIGGSMGAAIGAGIGTFICPGIGTAVGTVLGSMIGGSTSAYYTENILSEKFL